MPFSPEFRDYILDLLEPLAPHVEAKRFFGGLGFFYREAIFAIAIDDVLYFKVDEASREIFAAAGSGPFTYRRATGSRVVNAYWRVPDEVLDDEESFLQWARRAVDVGLAAERAKAKKPRHKRTRS